ncbi:MAG: NADH-quinone oxidoreductase subunit E [Deltaproteobacteria bacterium]
MLRRLALTQPDTFAFTPANAAWADAQITKYPEGRQASAIIPLLWRAQEQEGWLSKPAIEHVADKLGMAYIRALEVATFYFMFQLQPVGSVAHVQVCGTLSCMLMGAEDLMAACEHRIGHAHSVSHDGKFSWEEVECLGACANAPMAQIGKDYYEDLSVDILNGLLDQMADGKVPVPGPQNGRYASEPASGLTTLKDHAKGRAKYNTSAQLAVDIGDTLTRIQGTEVPLTTPWQGGAAQTKPKSAAKAAEPKPSKGKPVDQTGVTVQEATATSNGSPKADVSENDVNRKDSGPAKGRAGSAGSTAKTPAESDRAGVVGGQKRPTALGEARGGQADDLKVISGVGPKLEALLHSRGIFHFDQIAKWKATELAWIDDNLEGFKGRASRDNWVAQAADLAKTAKRK